MTGFPVSNVRSQTASESCAVSETAVVLFLSLFQSDSLFSSVLCPSAESVFTSTAAAPENSQSFQNPCMLCPVVSIIQTFFNMTGSVNLFRTAYRQSSLTIARTGQNRMDSVKNVADADIRTPFCVRMRSSVFWLCASFLPPEAVPISRIRAACALSCASPGPFSSPFKMPSTTTVSSRILPAASYFLFARSNQSYQSASSTRSVPVYAPPKNNSRLPGRQEKYCFAWVHVK